MARDEIFSNRCCHFYNDRIASVHAAFVLLPSFRPSTICIPFAISANSRFFQAFFGKITKRFALSGNRTEHGQKRDDVCVASDRRNGHRSWYNPGAIHLERSGVVRGLRDFQHGTTNSARTFRAGMQEILPESEVNRLSPFQDRAVSFPNIRSYRKACTLLVGEDRQI
jgi:hypothetical protein